jgi:hypothetical protein
MSGDKGIHLSVSGDKEIHLSMSGELVGPVGRFYNREWMINKIAAKMGMGEVCVQMIRKHVTIIIINMRMPVN